MMTQGPNCCCRTCLIIVATIELIILVNIIIFDCMDISVYTKLEINSFMWYHATNLTIVLVLLCLAIALFFITYMEDPTLSKVVKLGIVITLAVWLIFLLISIPLAKMQSFKNDFLAKYPMLDSSNKAYLHSYFKCDMMCAEDIINHELIQRLFTLGAFFALSIFTCIAFCALSYERSSFQHDLRTFQAPMFNRIPQTQPVFYHQPYRNQQKSNLPSDQVQSANTASMSINQQPTLNFPVQSINNLKSQNHVDSTANDTSVAV